MHIVKHEAWIGDTGSRQVAGQSMLIVNDTAWLCNALLVYLVGSALLITAVTVTVNELSYECRLCSRP